MNFISQPPQKFIKCTCGLPHLICHFKIKQKLQNIPASSHLKQWNKIKYGLAVWIMYAINESSKGGESLATAQHSNNSSNHHRTYPTHVQTRKHCLLLDDCSEKLNGYQIAAFHQLSLSLIIHAGRALFRILGYLYSLGIFPYFFVGTHVIFCWFLKTVKSWSKLGI